MVQIDQQHNMRVILKDGHKTSRRCPECFLHIQLEPEKPSNCIVILTIIK